MRMLRKSAHVDMNHMYARLGERWWEGCALLALINLSCVCHKITNSTKRIRRFLSSPASLIFVKSPGSTNFGVVRLRGSLRK